MTTDLNMGSLKYTVLNIFRKTAPLFGICRSKLLRYMTCNE